SEFAVEALYKTGETLAQLGRLDDASAAFEQFAHAHPDHALAADALLRAGDAAFAAADFEHAAALYQRMLETPRGDLEEGVLYRLAVARHNSGDTAGGAEVFRQLIEKFPESSRAVEARLRIGQHLLREEADAVKSLEYFQAALDAAPDGANAGEILEGMALARFETKDFEGAAELLARILADHPTTVLNADTYAWLGQHYFDREEWASSIRAFEALLQNAPNYENRHRILFLIGRAQEGVGNTKEALRRYAEVQQSAPQSPAGQEAQYRTAQLYEVAGDTPKAVAAFEQAAGANAGEWAARARFHLGEIMESQENYDEAARHFMRVAILFLHDELSPESLWRAGQAFEKAQKPEEAKRTYQELAQDYPDSEQARQAQERLNALGG
ncbi:MAG: tetratricopeptide repeat protein, partial [Candidatus Hydrogenedentales bacterium]